MLHFEPFGKTFNPEFIKSPFLETVKIKIVNSLVTSSGNIDFDFTEKSQYFIGKHIRNRFYALVLYRFYVPVLVVCASDDSVREMMLAAHDLNFDNGQYAFISIDILGRYVSYLGLWKTISLKVMKLEASDNSIVSPSTGRENVINQTPKMMETGRIFIVKQNESSLYILAFSRPLNIIHQF